jgi:epoxyqueuosine reductase
MLPEAVVPKTAPGPDPTGDAPGEPGKAAPGEDDRSASPRVPAADRALELGETIVKEARALGFHRVGLVPVAKAARHDLYSAWLAAGHHGDMAYLATPAHVEPRANAATLLAGAKTLVAVALAYPAETAPLVAADSLRRTGPRGDIARYARGADYHTVMKTKLFALARAIAVAAGTPVAARPCVDTAPLLERDEAERAGLGFVAKNTMLIAPGLGSWVLLGELLLDAEATLPTPPPRIEKRCGSCRACLDACPTGAFVDAFALDARRCIAYLTIELTGSIPRELRPLIGTRIFGCDVCQEVCPWNAGTRSGEAPAAAELAPHPARIEPELIALLQMGAYQFRRFVNRSALRRVHRAQFMRNVCVALGNAGDPAAIAPLREALTDDRALVRAHAAWALGRLADQAGLAARLAADPGETDAEVRVELELALAAASDPSSANEPSAGRGATSSPAR